MRIDHRTRSVRFGTDLSEAQRTDLPEGPHVQSMPSEQIRHDNRYNEESFLCLRPVSVVVGLAFAVQISCCLSPKKVQNIIKQLFIYLYAVFIAKDYLYD